MASNRYYRPCRLQQNTRYLVSQTVESMINHAESPEPYDAFWDLLVESPKTPHFLHTFSIGEGICRYSRKIKKKKKSSI